ncbi:MAG TPA: DoxX family protein [Turneriella sp.]|nr:DoxX family protein [Turneriella sp.]
MDSIISGFGKIGRYIFCIPLVAFGMNHLTQAPMMAGMVPIPGGVFWVYFTGVAMLLGAIGIITNFKGLGALAAFLTGVLLLIYVFTIHLPGLINAKDVMSRMMSLMMVLKDAGLAGGAWAIALQLKK